MHEINTSNWNIRTDLIIEKEALPSAEKEIVENEKYTISRITSNSNNYTTISFEDITDKDNYKEIETVFIKELKQFLKNIEIPKDETVLVIGLGNSNSTPDSLGPKTINNILVTRHLYKLGEVENTYQNVAAFKPEVTGITGIETKDLINSIIKTTSAKLLIVIDALASSSINRVNKTIQITDAGIAPGSGVGNNREALNQQHLKIPVIAIGVPTIVDASTIVSDTFEYIKQHFSYQLTNHNNPKIKLIHASSQDYSNHKTNLTDDQKQLILGEVGKLTPLDLKKLIDEVLTPIKYNLMVTPKEIDFLIEKLSLLIGNGNNKSLHDSFNPTK